MKIAVQGIWHLGSVTSICLSSIGFKVLALDEDHSTINNLKNNILPVYEPGLKELLIKHENNLTFSTTFEKLKTIKFLWVTYDTPVDNNDNANTDFVLKKIILSINYLQNNSIILISSQLPVGSISILESFAKKIKKIIHFAYSPENLRLGSSISVFLNPDRIIIGIRNNIIKKRLEFILKNLSSNLIWMTIESSEMSKHAINSFLALSVTFANELAVICEKVGADAKEVELALKSESRIGKKAYLSPGGPFSGGTLARDIRFLEKISNSTNLKTPIITSVSKSNSNHKLWHQRVINEEFAEIKNKKFLIMGLTYKVNTDTLRRSQSIEIIKWLVKNKSIVYCYDPIIKKSNNNIFKKAKLLQKLDEFKNYDVIIIVTPWPEFYSIFKQKYNETDMKKIIILDQNRLIKQLIHKNSSLKYITVGYVSKK